MFTFIASLQLLPKANDMSVLVSMAKTTVMQATSLFELSLLYSTEKQFQVRSVNRRGLATENWMLL